MPKGTSAPGNERRSRRGHRSRTPTRIATARAELGIFGAWRYVLRTMLWISSVRLLDGDLWPAGQVSGMGYPSRPGQKGTCARGCVVSAGVVIGRVMEAMGRCLNEPARGRIQLSRNADAWGGIRLTIASARDEPGLASCAMAVSLICRRRSLASGVRSAS